MPPSPTGRAGRDASAREGPTNPAATRPDAFYCDAQALDPQRRKRHFEVLGPTLVAKRIAVRALGDGYEFEFPSDPVTYRQLAEWIDGERECCPLFDLAVHVGPDHGAIALRLTGRAGTKAFIEADGKDWVRPVRGR